jgi:hypothetical protein
MLHYIEKRQHLRIPLAFVTVDVYSTLKQIESTETCSIVDISVSGMKLISSNHYEINQPLRVTFILPGSTIPIRGDVIVMYQQPRNSLLHTGVQFTNLGLVEFALLKKYIESTEKRN